MLEAAATDRLCVGPASEDFTPRMQVPAGSWDSHAHVIGTAPQWPQVRERFYTPPPASPADYMRMLDGAGLQYGVLVQISVHGTDNGLMLEALRAQPKRLRGIAVIDSTRPTDALLRALAESGVVGLRLAEMGGGIGFDQLENAASVCRTMGWHLQLCAPGERYLDRRARLHALGVPCVLEHMAFCVQPGKEALRRSLLDLVDASQCYVKLTSPFRLSTAGFPYADIAQGAMELITRAPRRVLWGSDWPHVGLFDPQQPPHVADLIDALASWGVDDAARRAILVNNPSQLYGTP